MLSDSLSKHRPHQLQPDANLKYLSTLFPYQVPKIFILHPPHLYHFFKLWIATAHVAPPANCCHLTFWLTTMSPGRTSASVLRAPLTPPRARRGLTKNLDIACPARNTVLSAHLVSQQLSEDDAMGPDEAQREVVRAAIIVRNILFEQAIEATRPFRLRRQKWSRNFGSVDEEDEYEMERILDARVNRTTLQYRIQWLGYDDNQEWYDASNFKDSPHRVRHSKRLALSA